MIKSVKELFSKTNPFQHYLHHFLLANLGLFLAYVVFGSITIWEVILYFFMAFIPITDQFFHVVLHYLDNDVCRQATDYFIGGDYAQIFILLHSKRELFTQLILHNLLLYFALWALLFVFLMFDKPLAFYGLMGLLIHLMQDIANDEYELQSISRWLWPVQGFFRA